MECIGRIFREGAYKGINIAKTTFWDAYFADNTMVISSSHSNCQSSYNRMKRIMKDFQLKLNEGKTIYLCPSIEKPTQSQKRERSTITTGPIATCNPVNKAQYLGQAVKLSTKTRHTKHETKVIQETSITARKIKLNGCTTKIKRTLVNSLVNSKIRYISQLRIPPTKDMDKVAKAISYKIKHTDLIQYSCLREIMFIDEDKGGLGITHPHEIATESFITTATSLLNSHMEHCQLVHQKALQNGTWQDLTNTLDELKLEMVKRGTEIPAGNLPNATIADGTNIFTDGSFTRKNNNCGGAIIVTSGKRTVENTIKFKYPQGRDNAYAEIYTLAILVSLLQENQYI